MEVDESYLGGRRDGKRGQGAAGTVPVFGILQRDGNGTWFNHRTEYWCQLVLNI